MNRLNDIFSKSKNNEMTTIIILFVGLQIKKVKKKKKKIKDFVLLNFM